MSYRNETAVLVSKEQIEYVESDLSYTEKELIVKTKLLGVCTSDCLNYINNNSHYFGHELIAEVISDYGDFKKGDMVTIFHKHGCQNCLNCKNNLFHLCLSATYVPVGFQNYIRVPHESINNCVFKVPKSEDYTEYVFLDSISCVTHAIGKLNLTTKKEKVLILGTGFMAMLFAMLLKNENKEVELWGRNPKKISNINHHLPELKFINSIEEIGKYDICIDTSGKSELINELQECILPQGQLLLFSKLDKPIVLDHFRNNEIVILFSKHTTRADIQKSIELISKNEITTKPFLTFFNHLHDLEGAIRRTLSHDIVRGVITLD
ncbi:alcohol dehydrogenase catalytic domain-containing protein [Paenibacillus sp. GSMTC-2017]|uniref:alcohol dehydrogenase catalytic domain-containing protein n=1 Tax=Paenibacillus sp. GSMTC-2017 TaxID=2794350 RepID=UPI0018DA00B5